MKFFVYAALTALPFVAFSAQSITLTQPSYTHVSASYTDGNRTQSGIFLDAEYELDHQFFVTGTYQNSRYRTGGNSFRESVIDLGLGRYFTIADGLTWDLSASVGRYAQSGNVFGSGSNFHTLNTGFRNRFEAFETRVGYRYIKYEGMAKQHGLVASGWYYFTPQMSVGVTFSDVYSQSTWGFGARILF
ncbi:hypothetical protein [Aliidiomarina celeris]|uniref:hypothetical protein n=1 Tax=Aliidiomarina celeris TaxID=2249428 RepID=UPI000DE966C8|nr:hypothetical protein [Aliidiomarina celeris]